MTKLDRKEWGKEWLRGNAGLWKIIPNTLLNHNSVKPRKDNGQYISPFSFKDDQFKPGRYVFLDTVY